MRHTITNQTSFEQMDQLLREYELVLSRVYVDRDGYNVTLSEANGQTIALGMADSFHEALEDAFRDVDGLAVVSQERVA